MKTVTIEDLKKIHVPIPGSHKGQNGRLLIIGGSHLFHAASLWSLTVASRIVDLVHYASVPENNAIVKEAKIEFRNGIVIPRENIEDYIQEDDVILIGPGMMRAEGARVTGYGLRVTSLEEIEKIQDEGIQTMALTNYLLAKYPEKQWVIDAGALQMMDVSLIPKHAILTPHHGEFQGLSLRATHEVPLSGTTSSSMGGTSRNDIDAVKQFAKEYHCIVLLKGEKDIACNGGKEGSDTSTMEVSDPSLIEGGNPGMTKGGTGDVLAGLIAALACTNDPFVSTIAGSFINKKAGDALYEKVGPYFNATDLANEIPVTMKRLLK